ncbi:hypothetical protein FOXB_00815 [Fusarium oxysporum f. sp. conglutinans Fo5176]|uniref:Uncharacterized protein n=1 Tax=Fusarium oxysporum (strain Fo5176) TaxID=660025 RepID=F9F340_FUSOF|nr:hypothetical protein FOXB_00815 [Fusarium oxysporum f. sp. conglutinans Fo5176]
MPLALLYILLDRIRITYTKDNKPKLRNNLKRL